MSSERAGTPAHGALNREKALPVIEYARNLPLAPADAILDRLEACVVPDPRLARIEALCDAADDNEQFIVNTRAVRAILRGES